MMRLTDTAETFEKVLPSGVTVTLRPLDGPLFHAAQMAAAHRVASEEWPEGLDRANEAHRLGVGLSIMAQEMARLAVVAWSGVEDAGCTPDNAALLARMYPRDGEAIYAALAEGGAAALDGFGDEGNVSAPGSNGDGRAHPDSAPVPMRGGSTPATPAPAATAPEAPQA